MTEQPEEPTNSNPEQQQRHQGVLWKRRDVFKNKWRPRWFVLQPQEAVLTYYLLSKTEAAATSTISTPLRRTRSSGVNNNGNTIPDNHNRSYHSSVSDITNATPQQRGRADTGTSTAAAVISEDPVDYDVVPRGAIYLAGCQVSINHALSRPAEGLFALTIVPPQSEENEIHLAARTEEARAVWVQRLEEACVSASGSSNSRDGDSISNANNNNNNSPVGRHDDLGGTSWRSTSPTETLFDNVPHSLSAKIEQSLETYLELAEERNANDNTSSNNDNTDTATALSWSPIFQDRDGVSAFTRQDLYGRTLMKSTAIIPHHPKQVASLLLDSTRRPDFESNVSKSERLEVLNPFTFLDYYAYKAVWPTSPRDFAVVLHWQVLERSKHNSNSNSNGSDDSDQEQEQEQAIVTLAFSCPEADELTESSAGSQQHVRARLHASFYLLRLITEEQGEGGGGEGDTSSPGTISKCHVTRILSYNLGGSLPRNLTTTVLMQQAGIPGVLARHLKEVEPNPPARLSANNDGAPMTNESVIRDVVDDLLEEDDALQSGARRRLSFDKSVNEKVAGMGSAPSPEDASPRPGDSQRSSTSELSIVSQALFLLAPLVIYHCAVAADLSSLLTDNYFECVTLEAMPYWFLQPPALFCVSAFLAVRYVVLQSLGKPIVPPRLVGPDNIPISCSFSVDLKGVLRFISMKKEEKQESTPMQNVHAEISVVHIVATALHRAMRNHSDCWNYQRVSMPPLGIGGYYRYPSSALDLSVSSGDRIVTLEDFEYTNIQAVATDLLAAERKLQHQKDPGWLSSLLQSFTGLLPLIGDGRPRRGRCLILLTHTDSDMNQRSSSSDSVGVEITPGRLPEGLDVLVVVGGVRLVRSTAPPAAGSPLRAPPPKPVLSLSVTVNTPSLLDTGKCSAFAEELQKLVQFPELCDDE